MQITQQSHGHQGPAAADAAGARPARRPARRPRIVWPTRGPALTSIPTRLVLSGDDAKRPARTAA